MRNADSSGPTTGPASSGIRDSIVCPVCATSGATYFAAGRDRLFGLARGTFDLYRCASCSCLFQHPMPGDSETSCFYPDDYWWSGQKPARGAAARALHRLEHAYRETVVRDHVRFLLRCARDYPQDRRSLLDIGCGSGSFLSVARRCGFTPSGMDSSAHAVAAAQGLGIEVRRGAIGCDIWESRRFDFVTLHHVLEHLPDPRAGLRYAAGLLAPQGSLIIQVPNVASMQARFFGERWYGLDVPRHLINFTPRGLSLLLRETGFQVESTARFSLRDNPASIASSLFPGLDPIGRRGRRLATGSIQAALLECLYLGIFLLSVPPALLESALGRGGTVWVQAKKSG